MSTAQNLTELALRFLINLLFCGLIVHFFYYPKSLRKDYVFTFLTFSSAMLLLLYVMSRVDVGVGLTWGLFAIFGVIRYRTETVPIREMTYLFVIIAIAAVNGLAPLFKTPTVSAKTAEYILGTGNVIQMLAANILALLLICVLERSLSQKWTSSKIILYDRIELITPQRREELLRDIETRCGIKPVRVEIGNVDFLKDAAYIKVYYNGNGENTSDIQIRKKQFVEEQFK